MAIAPTGIALLAAVMLPPALLVVGLVAAVVGAIKSTWSP